MLQQAHHRLTVETARAGFTDVTRRVSDWLAAVGAADGLVTVFVRHTSASLVIQENADPDVLADLGDTLAQLAPVEACYRHQSEGADDMPAHIKAMLTATSVQVPVVGGRMVLGTWQALYLVEHRRMPHRRQIALVFQGTLKRS